MLSGLPFVTQFKTFPYFKFDLKHKLNIIKIDKDFRGVTVECCDYKLDNKFTNSFYLTAKCHNLNDLSNLIEDVDEYLENDSDFQRKRQINIFVYKKHDFSFTYTIVKTSEIKKYRIWYKNDKSKLV